MTEETKPDQDLVLVDGDISDYLLAITKGTVDMIFKNAEVDSFKPDPKKGGKVKVKIPGDMLALYTFYAYTAKWQETHKIRCTTGYAMNGLEWTEPRVIRAKKALMRIGLVFDEYGWGEEDGRRVKRSYIRFRYYISKKSTTKRPLEIRGGSNLGVGDSGDKCFRASTSNALELVSESLNTPPTPKEEKNTTPRALPVSATQETDCVEDSLPIKKQSPKPKQLVDPQTVIDAWNEAAAKNPTLPKKRYISSKSKTRKALEVRVKDSNWVSKYKDALEVAASLNWKTPGRDGRVWAANFDWFLREESPDKLIGDVFDFKGKLPGHGLTLNATGSYYCPYDNPSGLSPEQLAEIEGMN